MKYVNNGKIYEVESITFWGCKIQVNGTTITDCKNFGEMIDMPSLTGYDVFCDSDEIHFDTFDEAYEFAMTKQKNTFRLPDKEEK